MSEQVTMTADERAEWEAFKAEKAKKEAAELRKQQRETYQELVNEELAAAIPELRALSEQIKTTKDALFSNFKAVLDMKADVVGFKEDGQYSHTFRLTLGVNTVDGWTDMVETGIAMVRRYLESLATDDKSKALVNTVLRLLSKDRQGNLNASKVLQLQKMAEESHDDQFVEAVKIIGKVTSLPRPAAISAHSIAMKAPGTHGAIFH